MSFIVYDFEQLYQQTWGRRPYTLQGTNELSDTQINSDKGNLIKTEFEGREVWLPIEFKELDSALFEGGSLLFPYATIRISGKKTIVKTPLAERGGTVKEYYSMDDYSIKIQGFLIDSKNRLWPEADMIKLKTLWSQNVALVMDNALTNLFLGRPDDSENNRVVIESIDLPEMESKKMHVRPFSLTLESDSIFSLDV